MQYITGMCVTQFLCKIIPGSALFFSWGVSLQQPHLPDIIQLCNSCLITNIFSCNYTGQKACVVSCFVPFVLLGLWGVTEGGARSLWWREGRGEEGWGRPLTWLSRAECYQFTWRAGAYSVRVALWVVSAKQDVLLFFFFFLGNTGQHFPLSNGNRRRLPQI